MVGQCCLTGLKTYHSCGNVMQERVTPPAQGPEQKVQHLVQMPPEHSLGQVRTCFPLTAGRHCPLKHAGAGQSEGWPHWGAALPMCSPETCMVPTRAEATMLLIKGSSISLTTKIIKKDMNFGIG